MATIRIALCQLNPKVGDIEGNADCIVEWLSRATEAGADVAVFPELAITGYPPEDLLLKPKFIDDNLAAMQRVAEATTDCTAVFGFVDRSVDLYNAAAVCHGGELKGIYRKTVLPNYSVFDEQRYFTSGTEAEQLFCVAGVKLGVVICEDAWSPTGPVAHLANGGAELILSLNASPYMQGRADVRLRTMATRAVDASVPIVYVNQVGGQDELVFDGGSMILDSEGGLNAQSPQFVEELSVVDIDVRSAYRKRLIDPRGRAPIAPLKTIQLSDGPRATPEPVKRLIEPLEPLGEVYNALVLGVSDYVKKNGFDHVVLGLSGGIDSAIVAAIATDALGSDRVHAIGMPSRYSSDHSVGDARQLADNLGIGFELIPITEPHEAMERVLEGPFGAQPAGLTDENLQSRLRGVTLMAVSNERNWLVLTTGNKSEMAVGYSTLYGDTAGGFAVIKDVFKTTVYELCRWRNSQGDGEMIPMSIIEKPPSAELRPDQRDDQSLPAYEILDPILEAYVENDLTVTEIEDLGHNPELVRRLVRLVDLAEYKRRQSPIGVRVTPKAFGKDRRIPITNAYRG
jgi:NAD+ synthase (glutamine-hydrolysing)